MHKLGATLLLTLTLFAGYSLAAQSTTPATPPPSAAPQTPSTAPQTPSAAQPTPQEQAHQTIEKIGSDLSLTADQKTKLEPIVAGEIQQVRDLKADTTMTPEQKQAKFQETLSGDHAKIDAILTPEQKQKLAQLRQQQAAPQGQPQPQSQPQAAPQTKPGTSQPPK
jgi:Spy/CpxP family protein refolding chaperone